ncbi:hypothetical protein OsI_26234 [Oryza sativa Indica Group]|uniref:Uncharacterized protein n=1 Tax=Oryza sativa subsp. indica TaxID=39946 RepID=A2YLY5_ORYSI|nr:hypothetical protein OsI_26234 [Oryza sativa Indica Group]
MKYTIGKLLSTCAKGESIIDMPNPNKDLAEGEKEHTSESHGSSSKAKYLPGNEFHIGRNEEIDMIRNMVLGNSHYVAEATSLKIRQEAEKLHIPRKGWITETLQKIDHSKRTQQTTEVSPRPENEVGNSKAEYIRVSCKSTVTDLRNPAVIPIVGISGVGKSALAKFIFNDANVQEHFGDQSAWVYMPDSISQVDMIKKIIYSFDPMYDLSCMTSLETVHSELQKIIEGKRLLLVLDDVWDEIRVIWNCLRSVLSKGAPGSVVLVTTQLYSVANFVGTAGPVILDPLQTDDSWTLLKSYAFVDPCRSLSTEDLEEIGRKIAQRIPELPQLVKVIGATLRSKLEESHWSHLLNSWWWNISDNFEIRVISSLGSCYSVLPGHLRQCVVYCAIFPRNFVFEKDKLVQMWIANGFVQLNNSTGFLRLEDVGGQWFDEIVNRGFLQPACKTGYIMHDLVWDFASAVSSNECHGINNKLKGVSQDVRYLSIDMEGLNALPDNFNIKQLRATILIGDIDHSDETYLRLGRIFDGSTSLRVLAFSSFNLGAEIRNDVSALKYLRYLDLSFTGIKILPDSVCSLSQLQVLDLRGCTFDELPGNMNCLINLRHLHASTGTIAQISGIGKLTKLQELHDYYVEAKDGHGITELSDMSHLRGSLCISNLGMVTDPAEALEANIIEKNYITALELRWFDTLLKTLTPDLSKSILGCLSPPKYLQELKLYGYSGFELPDWVGQLKHVRVVKISWCKNLNVLPPLGQLEHLQKLKLHGLPSIKDIDSDICGTSNVVFRSLKELSFGYMENWESWTYAGSSDFIPNLQKLQICSCVELREVPFESLGSATKEIIIRDCDPYDDMFSRAWDRTSITEKWLQRLTSLQELQLSECHVIPSIVSSLSSLKRFTLEDCDSMHSIPPNSLPGNLKELQIMWCSDELEARCQNPTGDAWRPEKYDIELWRDKKMDEWKQRKMEYGKRKLIKMRQKKEEEGLVMNEREELLKSSKEEPLYQSDKHWQSDKHRKHWQIELWRRRKIDEWRDRKLEHGRTKLIQMQLKKESLGIPMSWREKSPKSSKGEGESLYQSDNYGSLGQMMQEGHEWPRKQHMEEQSFIEKEKSSSLNEQPEEDESDKELLEEWLQQSEGDQWPEQEWKLYSWMRRKLEEELYRNKDDPSSLMKEREEWLKEEERKLRSETLGKDWANIAHVPYIRVKGKIVQNLYT